MREYVTDRAKNVVELDVVIDGEKFTLRPGKKSEAMVNILAVDKSDPAKEIEYTRALMSWFIKSLDKDHEKNARKNKLGHQGDESVEGCQACRLVDCLNDDDHPMDLDTVFKVANDALGDLSSGPTG